MSALQAEAFYIDTAYNALRARQQHGERSLEYAAALHAMVRARRLWCEARVRS